jgi:hypothetical protein
MNRARNSEFGKSALSPSSQSRDILVVSRWILLGGLLLGAVGASFAPWVDRPPAALVLTAPDLAEFVKFLPEVRNGTLTIQRLSFLLPLFMVTLSLPMVISTRQLAFPRWVRWPILAIQIPLSLTLLPPVWSPSVLLSAEFRIQAMACLLCLGLVIVSRWLRATPVRPLALLLVLVSLVTPGLATWQFLKAQNAISGAYGSPIAPAWGMWVTLAGFALAICGAALILLKIRALTKPHHPE